MNLAAGIIFYQDRLGLERLLESLNPKVVSHVFAIDGKFTDYEANNQLSDDGGRQLVANYGTKFDNVVLSGVIGSEVEKRNRYLELCRIYDVDYLLYIDSDEYIEPASDWAKFEESVKKTVRPDRNFYGIRYIHTDIGDYSPYPRLYYKPGEIEYYENHNLMLNRRTGKLIRSPSVPKDLVIDGLYLRGNDDLRSKDRIKRGDDYQVKLIAAEEQRERALRREGRISSY